MPKRSVRNSILRAEEMGIPVPQIKDLLSFFPNKDLKFPRMNVLTYNRLIQSMYTELDFNKEMGYSSNVNLEALTGFQIDCNRCKNIIEMESPLVIHKPVEYKEEKFRTDSPVMVPPRFIARCANCHTTVSIFVSPELWEMYMETNTVMIDEIIEEVFDILREHDPAQITRMRKRKQKDLELLRKVMASPEFPELVKRFKKEASTDNE